MKVKIIKLSTRSSLINGGGYAVVLGAKTLFFPFPSTVLNSVISHVGSFLSTWTIAGWEIHIPTLTATKYSEDETSYTEYRLTTADAPETTHCEHEYDCCGHWYIGHSEKTCFCVTKVCSHMNI